MLPALSLWRFLQGLQAAPSVRRAFGGTGSGLNERAAYRILARFAHALARIRTRLLSRCPAPDPPPGATSLGLTVCHLSAAFPGTPCPVAAYHDVFQESFL